MAILATSSAFERIAGKISKSERGRWREGEHQHGGLSGSEVADVRVHGTRGEAPIERFRRAEATALK